jgi:septation ring formation regulator EzrA
MDPLSFVASIIAVVEVGVDISLQLSRLARKMKGAGKAVAEIADEFSSMASTLTNLRETLEEGRRKGQVLHSQAFAEDIERLLKRIQTVQNETWELIPKNFKETEDKTSRMSVLDRFNWVFKSQKARAITQKMNTLKSTLTVMLSALQVAKLEKLIPYASVTSLAEKC